MNYAHGIKFDRKNMIIMSGKSYEVHFVVFCGGVSIQVSCHATSQGSIVC